MAHRGPGWLRWVTRVSLVVGAIALVATIHAVGLAALTAYLAVIGTWFVVLIAIDVAVALCDARVIYEMSRGETAPRFGRVVVAQFAGRAVNSVTPGSNLGEALKVSLLAQDFASGTSAPRRRRQRAVRRASPLGGSAETKTPSRTGQSPDGAQSRGSEVAYEGLAQVGAAVGFSIVGNVVAGLAIIGLGSLATPWLFATPAGLGISLVAIGVVALTAAVGVVQLVRHGMISSVVSCARRLRLISLARHDRWRDRLGELDRHLRGDHVRPRRRVAIGFVVLSQVLQRGMFWVMLVAMGYRLGGAQLVVVLTIGVLVNWLSSIVPMGLGLYEGGSGLLFLLIGAPAALGVALAVARRTIQIAFAVLGFSLLAVDRCRLASLPLPMRTWTQHRARIDRGDGANEALPLGGASRDARRA